MRSTTGVCAVAVFVPRYSVVVPFDRSQPFLASPWTPGTVVANVRVRLAVVVFFEMAFTFASPSAPVNSTVYGPPLGPVTLTFPAPTAGIASSAASTVDAGVVAAEGISAELLWTPAGFLNRRLYC